MNLTARRPVLRATAEISTLVFLAIGALVGVGGLPPDDELPRFIAGCLVLGVLASAFCVTAWHLLVREIADEAPTMTVMRRSKRETLADLLTLATIATAVGGAWDASWHSKYNAPFGEDFFWRPHLLIYFGLAVLGLVGLWSWIEIITTPGTMQQRFRSNRLLGTSVLLGIYTVYAIIGDPIWHAIYGTDIQVWSLPHVMTVFLHFLMAVVAIGYQKSLVGDLDWTPWRFLSNLGWRHLVVVSTLASALLVSNFILTIQWHVALVRPAALQSIEARPEWLLAAFLGALAGLYGSTALRVTHVVGSATLTGLILLSIRYGLDLAFSGTWSSLPTIWMLLALLTSIDIINAVSLRIRATTPPTWVTALVLGITTAAMEPWVLQSLLPYMTTDPQTALTRAIATAVTGFAGLKLGIAINHIIESSASVDEVNSINRHRLQTPAIYGCALLFVTIFIITASAPTS